MSTSEKTEYEKLVELFEGPARLPTPEEAKRTYDDRMNHQPAPGMDANGNLRIYRSKADIPPPLFTIIGDDEDPADISDLNDWDDV